MIFRSELAAKNHDFQTVQYTAAVKPGEKAELLYEIVQRQGHNAKQNNVTIERAAVETVNGRLQWQDGIGWFRRLLVTACALVGAVVRAENVDLSTVPTRNTVQLTIYNSEDLTLVRETRKVSFKPGANPLQFSWANTLIDPTSVELRFLTHGEKLTVLDTTFPHAKPQMLYWNVQSEMDGEATIEITYFTSGISWSADYIGIAGADESQLNLEGFVRVNNHSGEEYEDAQVRLVVGRINLVQKIAELARIPATEVARLPGEDQAILTRQALRKRDERADGWNGGAAAARTCRAGATQGGRQGRSGRVLHLYDRRHGDDPQRLVEADAEPGSGQGAGEDPVPLPPRRIWRELVRMYLLTNDKESKLGTTPLPDGAVRLFRQNGRDGLSFLAAQAIKYVPIGDKIELNLGPDPEVIFELVKLRSWRDDLWMQVNGAEDLPPRRSAGRADRGQQLRCRLGRPHPLHPAGAELHEEADRPGSSPRLSPAT